MNTKTHAFICWQNWKSPVVFRRIGLLSEQRGCCLGILLLLALVGGQRIQAAEKKTDDHVAALESLRKTSSEGFWNALRPEKAKGHAGIQGLDSGVYRTGQPRGVVVVPGGQSVPLLKAPESAVRSELRVVTPELNFERWGLQPGKPAP
jgi:hypothetical protein